MNKCGCPEFFQGHWLNGPAKEPLIGRRHFPLQDHSEAKWAQQRRRIPLFQLAFVSSNSVNCCQPSATLAESTPRGNRYFTVNGADAVTFSHSMSSLPLA